MAVTPDKNVHTLTILRFFFRVSLLNFWQFIMIQFWMKYTLRMTDIMPGYILFQRILCISFIAITGKPSKMQEF